jgi:hypothetical protein
MTQYCIVRNHYTRVDWLPTYNLRLYNDIDSVKNVIKELNKGINYCNGDFAYDYREISVVGNFGYVWTGIEWFLVKVF